MTDLHSRLPQLAEEVMILDARLAAVVPYREEGAENGRGGMKRPHSPAPWNSAAALCRMDLHALARDIEREWRQAASFPVRERGGSDVNTRRALEVLPQLAYAQGVEDVLRTGVRKLERWARVARTVLGDLERPRRLPAMEGAGELACPGCRMLTLRMWPVQGIIRCVNPKCSDAEGRKMTGIITYSDAGGIQLTWQDDSTS